MLDVVVCTNLVNTTVAVQGLLRHGPARRTLLVYDPARLQAPEGLPPRVHARRQSRALLLLLSGLARLGQLHTLYLPHHQVNRHLLALGPQAREVALLDDGLDTHRERPVSVDPAQLRPGQRYLTFEQTGAPPAWLAAARLERCCPLQALAQRPGARTLAEPGVRHLLFESPGLDVQSLVTALALPPDETLVVVHPVPAKRTAIPPGVRTVAGEALNSEALLMAADGLHLYFGETILLYVAQALCRPGNRLVAMLSPAQRDNLVGLGLTPLQAPQPLASPLPDGRGLWSIGAA